MYIKSYNMIKHTKW